MRLRDDERAQSVQIGAVLLFAVLVIAFSSYQAFVVPNQNRAVEFNHNQQVRDQMQDLRNEIVSIHGEPSTRSVTLTLGTRYPSRLVAVNPGPPSGTIRTAGTGPTAVNLSVRNATATGETGDFWNGTDRAYNTGGVVYQPNYNVYGNAPLTIYENTVLYNQFRESNLTASGQTLIDDQRISVVTINGSLSRTQTGSTSVDLQPVSTSTTTVSITNASGNVTVAVATRLPESRWGSLLASQRVANGGHVVDYGVQSVPGSPFDLLRIELEPGVTYQLRMTKVGVGTQVTDEGSAYLTDVAGNATRLDVDDTTTVTLQVRDAYNNPVTGVQVNATAQQGLLSPQRAVTDDQGEARFTYDSSGVSGGQWIDLDFSITTDPVSTFDASTPENVTMQVRVQSPPAASGGGGGVYTTAWDRPPYTAARIASEQLSAGAVRGVPFRMRATDGGVPVSNAEVDYAVNDSAVATVDPGTGRTDAAGYNGTAVAWQTDGYLRAYTTTDATGDRINATLDRLQFESFEDPAETLVANGWYYNDSGNPGGGGAGIKAIGTGADDGTRVAYINGSSGGTGPGDRAVQLNYSLNTSDYDGLTVTYVAREPGSVDNPDTPDSGSDWNTNENLRLQYRAADGSWVTVDNVSSQVDGSEPISYVRRTTIENVANASQGDFAIRFRQGETTSLDEWQIDSVALVGLAVEDRVADLNQDPVADYRYSPTAPTTADTVTFDAARSDDPDDSVAAYDWDWTTDGSYDASGRTATHSYSSTGTYNATLRVTDQFGTTNTTTQEITVSAATGGFQSVGATNIVPSTSGQRQSFTFTPDTDLPGGTDVTINLDDPQQTSPLQVDYQGSAATSTGTIQNKNANADTASITWQAPSGGVTAGTQVRVWIDSVVTGADSQQTDPYDVTFTRADSGDSATAAFSVDQNAGGAELTNLAVEDLEANTNGQTQAIQFEPTTDLPAGEPVSISLVNAQGTDEVDYQNAGLSANVSTSDLSFTDQNADNAAIRLTPSSTITAGSTVQIDVSSVNTGSMSSAPYEVGFSRGDAGTASTTFGESFLVPSLSVRVDDLTDQAQDQPTFVGSYNVSNTNSSFQRVEITFENLDDSSATQSGSSTTTQGGIQYDNNYGSTNSYDITYDVIYSIDGSERVVASQTVSENPDAQNPAGNANLATANSAQLTSWSIQDTSNNGQGPRYDFTYQVSSGSFSQVQFGILNLPGSGSSEIQTSTSTSETGVTVNPPSGYQENYRLVILVQDANGAVVDVVSIEDNADGTGSFSGP